jgi:tetratricopeptide (TPR) repeat protein
MAFLEEYLSFLSANFAARREILLTIVSLSLDRGKTTKTARDLATANHRIRHLLSEMPEDDPERSSVQDLLNEVVVWERMHLGPPTGLPADLREGFYSRGCFRLAFTESPDPHGIESLRRMELKPGVEDTAETEEWIRQSEDVLNRLPSGSLALELELVQLGMTYERLYTTSNSMHHIDQAVQYFRKGLEVGSGDSRSRMMLLSGLKSVLWKKCYATRLDGNCDAAIEATRQSLATGMEKREDLKILGRRLRLRYLRTDNEADLDESLQINQRLLGLTPPSDPDRPSVLHGLGLGFFLRSRSRRALSDAAAAVKYLEEAVAACPEQDPYRAEYLGDLGIAYQDKGRKASEPDRLGKAIPRFLEAVKAAEDNTRRKAVSWYYLAEGYLAGSGEDRAISDLDLAIDAYEKAVGLDKFDDEFDDNNTELQSYVLAGLGYAYLVRYEGTDDEETWENAITCLKKAVLLTSDGHHARAAHLGHLAQGYHMQYHKMKRTEFLQEAIRNYEAALASSHCLPLERIPHGKRLFGIHVLLKDWASAYRTASTLLSIIPFALIRSLENLDKKSLVAGLEGLACDAAAVALLAGERPLVALRLLETGRGIIMGSLLGLRSDIDQLQHEHPALAAEYLRLRDKVDSVRGPLSNPAAEWLPVQRPDYRHNASKELEQVIDAIRVLPGFESFLRGPSENEMKAAATTRPIVVINVSRLRCDAVIVTPSGITSRRLSGVTMRTIREASQHVTDVRSLKSTMLEWLWDKVAEPVMEALGLTSSPDGDEWPSVSWILTGPLVGLPLHAAGYHEAPDGKTVLDQAISSYSVSLASLVQMHTDRQKPGAHRRPEHAVLIGMPDLPHALKEVREVARISPTMQIHTPPPYAQDVLRALKTCDVFHFAGHGRSSREDPTSSALILSGAERLTESNLFDINLHKRRPFLAFLSACNTGQIKHDTFMDEGLHLIAACQVAGFQHVIGTLWEVSDRLCAEAARGIYEWMHGEDMSHASVSEGLHRTCRRLRMEWVQGGKERRAKLRDDENIEIDGVSEIEEKLRMSWQRTSPFYGFRMCIMVFDLSRLSFKFRILVVGQL